MTDHADDKQKRCLRAARQTKRARMRAPTVNRDRCLAAINAARDGFGKEQVGGTSRAEPIALSQTDTAIKPFKPWWRRLTSADVLSILEAPGLQIFRPKRFAGAHLINLETDLEFTPGEQDIGFAGLAICQPEDELKQLNVGPAETWPIDVEKRVVRLTRALAELDQLLLDPHIAAVWNNWASVFRTYLVPFEEYRKTTNIMRKYTSYSAENATSAKTEKKSNRKHPKGASTDRLIRDHLMPVFADIYHQTPTTTRGETPFQLFSKTFYVAAGLAPRSMETVIRAMTTKSRRPR